MSAETALGLTAMLFAACAAGRALEVLWVAPELGDGGIFDAALTPSPRWPVPSPARLLRLAQSPLTVALAVATIMASVLVLVGFRSEPGVRIALAVAVLILDRRFGFGRTGADQMMVIVAVVLIAASVAPSSSIPEVALAFLAAQLVLCFVTAGISKLANPAWRDGSALRRITRTNTYGGLLAPLARRSRRSGRFVVLSWTVMALEMAAPAMLLLDGRPLMTAVVLAGAFHVMTAMVMGLHEFPWAFAPAYPAVIFVAGQI